MAHLLILLVTAWPAYAGDVGESARFARVDWTQFPSGGFETPPSARPNAAYDAVLFHGKAGPGLSGVDLAVEGRAGAWGPWLPAALHQYPNGRFWGKVVLPAAARGRVKLRARTAAGNIRVELFDVEFFVDEREPAGAGLPPGPAAAEAPALSRRAWGARPPSAPYDPHLPERLTVHHTAGVQTFSEEDSLAELHLIQDYHQQGRRWNDVGYHFLIDAAGRVYRGRPVQAVGAHVKNKNTGNIGFSFMGNFQPPDSDAEPTPAQLEAFLRVARWVVEVYAVDARTLLGHRDQGSTKCPGERLYERVDLLRETLAAPPPADSAQIEDQVIGRLAGDFVALPQ